MPEKGQKVSVISLLTDFGQRDAYVGTMKGVIVGIAPSVTLIDITHDIRPQSIEEAAFVSFASYRYFPPETIHVVIVDPGVGSQRRPIAIRTAHGMFVGPDNGVFGYVLEKEGRWHAVHLTESRHWLPNVSQTFHGRDVFAPVAAHLAIGTPLDQLGTPIDDLKRLSLPGIRYLDAFHAEAQILYVDRFGNVITSLQANDHLAGDVIRSLGTRLSVRAGPHEIQGLCDTYTSVEAGRPLMYIGSTGFIEFAVREGSFAERFGLNIGEKLTFTARHRSA